MVGKEGLIKLKSEKVKIEKFASFAQNNLSTFSL
jgi:hypothetical protein